jgi:hydrogenase-4 component B
LDAPGAAWGRLAAAGALLHVWNHAFFKSLLFLGAGSVLHATGTREMSRLGGLWKTMPWTTCLFAFGAVAISALPPLNGLVSEFLIYLGLLEASAEHGRAALGALPATIALGVAGALALAAFVKAGGIVFLGASRTRAAAEAHESGWWMRAPMVGLGAACLLLALTPATAWPALDSVLQSWNPAWGASTAPASLVTLGHFQRVLALLLLAGAIALTLRSKFNGLRRAATWDCGYAAPTARIQYTAHSFSSMALGWFGRVLRPHTRLRRPRGLFPDKADHSETLPDVMLEHAFRPLATAVMSASGWVRQRQHGHLPEYILYLVAALAAVTAVIVLGSLR